MAANDGAGIRHRRPGKQEPAPLSPETKPQKELRQPEYEENEPNQFDDAKPLLAWRREYFARERSQDYAGVQNRPVTWLGGVLGRGFESARRRNLLNYNKPPAVVARFVRSVQPHAQVAACAGRVAVLRGRVLRVMALRFFGSAHSSFLSPSFSSSSLASEPASSSLHSDSIRSRNCRLEPCGGDVVLLSDGSELAAADDTDSMVWNRLCWSPDGQFLVALSGSLLFVLSMSSVDGDSTSATNRDSIAGTIAVPEIVVVATVSLPDSVGIKHGAMGISGMILHERSPACERRLKSNASSSDIHVLEIILLDFGSRAHVVHMPWTRAPSGGMSVQALHSSYFPSRSQAAAKTVLSPVSCPFVSKFPQVVSTENLHAGSCAVAYSSDGATFAVATSDSKLRLLRWTSHDPFFKTLGAFENESDNESSVIVRLQFSPSGARLLGVTFDGSVFVFDCKDVRTPIRIESSVFNASPHTGAGATEESRDGLYSRKVVDACWWPALASDHSGDHRPQYASKDFVAERSILLSIASGDVILWDLSLSTEANVSCHLLREHRAIWFDNPLFIFSAVTSIGEHDSGFPFALLLDVFTRPAIDAEQSVLQPLPLDSRKRSIASNWWIVAAIFWISFGFIDLTDPAADAAEAFAFAQRRKSRTERLSVFSRVSGEELMQSKIDDGMFDDALLLASAHGLSRDAVFRAQWNRAVAEAGRIPLSKELLDSTLGKLDLYRPETLLFVARIATGKTYKPNTIDEALLLLDFGIERMWHSPLFKASMSGTDIKTDDAARWFLLMLYQRDRIRTLSSLKRDEQSTRPRIRVMRHAISADEQMLDQLHEPECISWFRSCDLISTCFILARRCDFDSITCVLKRHLIEFCEIDLYDIFDCVPETCHISHFASLLSMRGGVTYEPWRNDETEQHPLERCLDAFKIQSPSVMAVYHAMGRFLERPLRNCGLPCIRSRAEQLEWFIKRSQEIEERCGLTKFALDLLYVARDSFGDEFWANQEAVSLVSDLEDLLMAQRSGLDSSASVSLEQFQQFDVKARLSAVLTGVDEDEVIQRLSRLSPSLLERISVDCTDDAATNAIDANALVSWLVDMASMGKFALCHRVLENSRVNAHTGVPLEQKPLIPNIVVLCEVAKRVCYAFPSPRCNADIVMLQAIRDFLPGESSSVWNTSRTKLQASLRLLKKLIMLVELLGKYDCTNSAGNTPSIGSLQTDLRDRAICDRFLQQMCSDVLRHHSAVSRPSHIALRDADSKSRPWSQLLDDMIALETMFMNVTAGAALMSHQVFFASAVRSKRVSLVRKLVLPSQTIVSSFELQPSEQLSLLVREAAEFVNSSASCTEDDTAWSSALDCLNIAADLARQLGQQERDLIARQEYETEQALFSSLVALSKLVTGSSNLPLPFVPVQVRLLRDRTDALRLALLGDASTPTRKHVAPWISRDMKLPNLNTVLRTTDHLLSSQRLAHHDALRQRSAVWLAQAHIARHEWHSMLDVLRDAVLTVKQSCDEAPALCLRMAERDDSVLSINERLELARYAVSHCRKQGEINLSRALAVCRFLRSEQIKLKCGAAAKERTFSTAWESFSFAGPSRPAGPVCLWDGAHFDNKAPEPGSFAALYSRKRSRRSKRQELEAQLLLNLDSESLHETLLSLAGMIPVLHSDTPRDAQELFAILRDLQHKLAHSPDDTRLPQKIDDVFQLLYSAERPERRSVVSKWSTLWWAELIVKLDGHEPASLPGPDLLNLVSSCERQPKHQLLWDMFDRSQARDRYANVSTTLSKQLPAPFVARLDAEKFAAEKEYRTRQLVSFAKTIAVDRDVESATQLSQFSQVLATAADWGVDKGELAASCIHALLESYHMEAAEYRDTSTVTLTRLRTLRPDRILLDLEHGHIQTATMLARFRTSFVPISLTTRTMAGLVKWLTSLEIRLYAAASSVAPAAVAVAHRIATIFLEFDGHKINYALFGDSFHNDDHELTHDCTKLSSAIKGWLEHTLGDGEHQQFQFIYDADSCMHSLLLGLHDLSNSVAPCDCDSAFSEAICECIVATAYSTIKQGDLAALETIFIRHQSMLSEDVALALCQKGALCNPGMPSARKPCQLTFEVLDAETCIRILDVRVSMLRQLGRGHCTVLKELVQVETVRSFLTDVTSAGEAMSWESLVRAALCVCSTPSDHRQVLNLDLVVAAQLARAALAFAADSQACSFSMFEKRLSALLQALPSERDEVNVGALATRAMRSLLQILADALTEHHSDFIKIVGDEIHAITLLDGIGKWIGPADHKNNSVLREAAVVGLIALAQDSRFPPEVKQQLLTTVDIQLGAGNEAASALVMAKRYEMIAETWGHIFATKVEPELTRAFTDDEDLRSAVALVEQCANQSSTPQQLVVVLEVAFDVKSASCAANELELMSAITGNKERAGEIESSSMRMCLGIEYALRSSFRDVMEAGVALLNDYTNASAVLAHVSTTTHRRIISALENIKVDESLDVLTRVCILHSSLFRALCEYLSGGLSERNSLRDISEAFASRGELSLAASVALCRVRQPAQPLDLNTSLSALRQMFG